MVQVSQGRRRCRLTTKTPSRIIVQAVVVATSLLFLGHSVCCCCAWTSSSSNFYNNIIVPPYRAKRGLATARLYSHQHHQQQQQQQQVKQEEEVISTIVNPSIMNVVNGIRDIVDLYDVFLLDMWGVMHDGSTPYEGVLETIRKLKQAGKDLIILSNSSKRNHHSISSLRTLGFDPEDFQQIITSGEVSFQMLAGTLESDSSSSWPLLTSLTTGGPDMRKVLVLGSGEDDDEYCSSCGWTLSNIHEANLILARGTFTINDGSSNIVEKNTDEKKYDQVLSDILQEAAKRKLPMLVSNPDKVRPDKERPPMPGAIGDAYERVLGGVGSVEAERLVKRVGKPFHDVYDLALATSNKRNNNNNNNDLSRFCMVGDALETDVTGGSAVGMASIWIINDGIHGPEVEEKGQGDIRVGATSVLDEFNDKSFTYAKGRKLQPTKTGKEEMHLLHSRKQ